MKSFRILRIALAALFLVGITLLLLDAAATRHCLGWMAKLQAGPALLNLTGNILLFLFPILLTEILGRIYCSVICPLGVLQDLFIRLGRMKWLRRFGKHFGPNRFTPEKEHKWLRFSIFVLFIILCIVPATGVFAHFLEPYSLYGKLIAAFTSSYYTWVAYTVVAVLFFVILTIALLRGRLWCNTICPVGTYLSIFSRKPLLAPSIDTTKCNGCGLCARNCKAECIDPKAHTIDMARCVDCYDCLSTCHQGAISIKPLWKKDASAPHNLADKEEPTTASDSSAFGAVSSPLQGQGGARSAGDTCQGEASAEKVPNPGRRKFLTTAGLLGLAVATKAQHKTDGGLAVIEQKKVPARAGRLLPAGAHSDRHFAAHCTACQLCISACPHGVLRPSMEADRFMQPEMAFDRGYCPVGCHACSDVCPTGALHLHAPEEKAATQIGHAVWIADNCVVLSDNVSCGNCERHCPADAIQMVPYRGDDNHRVPAVDTERCIGCGHCEYVCPSRPLSAIYVEPHSSHRTI